MKADASAVRDHRPIYIQVAESLRARILSGYYEDRLDGELKLVEEWEVSRRTIQQAIDILVREGLLRRHQGTGTFINKSGVARHYRAITSITDGVRAQGLAADYRILASAPEPASQAAKAFFALADGASVYRHTRLVLADRKPVAVADTLLNLERLKGLELSHLAQGLYEALRQGFGRTIVHAEDRYRPAIADAQTAKLLELGEPAAIYIAERRAFDQSGAPIELSTIFLVPVALEISISQVGADWPGATQPAGEPWNYRVGFGNFAG